MSRPRNLRRGIYLLPTMFTLGNLFCGFSSVAYASREQFSQAAILIVVAGVLDGFDGRIARLTGTTSAFGLEFDSMADLVSFGVAPAMLWFFWGLDGRLGWVVAFLYLVSAATRLARFNLQASVSDRRFFVGIPSPMAGGALAAIVFAFPNWIPGPVEATLLAVVMLLIGGLMLSRLRYRSFKDLDLRNRRSYIYVPVLGAILVGLGTQAQVSLLVLSLGYLLSAPLRATWMLARRGGAPAASDPPLPESRLADDRGTR